LPVILWNPANPTHHAFWREAQAAARTMGVRVSGIEFTSPSDFEPGFANMVLDRVDGVVVLPDPMTHANRSRLRSSCSQVACQRIALFKESAEAGILLSYGVSMFDNFRRAAGYVDRILKGANPAEMPIEQGTKFELVVNLKTAKLLRLPIAQSLVGRADQVIE
jgi:putative ABC transport system substrate-binding protein